METAKEMRKRMNSGYRVQVLDRAVHVLDLIAEAGVELGPSEIAARLGLHKSTIHRLLAVLEAHRLVIKHPVHGKYVLGTKLLELGNRSGAHLELRTAAMPVLQWLVAETQETSHIAVFDSDEMLSIANVEAAWALRLRSGVGRRSTLHGSAVGKCFLAFLPKAERDELLDRITLTRLTRRTLVTRRALLADLERTRKRGYSLDSEELEEGLRCISAPVWGRHGELTACISSAGPIFRVTLDRVPALGRSIAAAGERLSKAIGGSIPERSTRRRLARSPI